MILVIPPGTIMNKKLVSTVLALGLLFTSVAGLAQQKDVGAPDKKKGIERMSKELSLSAEQRVQVEAIFEAERKKVEAIFNEEKQKLQGVQQETRSSLQEVLTPEQMNKLEQKMRESSKNDGKKK
jgi:Spy/CpxP family protein refolding chaperone